MERKPILKSVPEREADALLAEHAQSDLSLAAFARSKGVRPWSLYNARNRMQKRTSARFAEVKVVDAPGTSKPDGAAIELQLPSGLRLRVNADFSEIALRRLLGVLASC